MCFTGGLKACLTSYHVFPADKAEPPLCYYQGDSECAGCKGDLTHLALREHTVTYLPHHSDIKSCVYL